MANEGPLVGILAGSGSDRPVMEKCNDRLEDLSIEYEIETHSAHRDPEYAGTAENRGVKVLIRATGMAAHPAGAVAGRTTLPVLGISIAAGALNGFDSLLSTVQMPPGVPAATVNGSANTDMPAAQMLAHSDDELARALEEYK